VAHPRTKGLLKGKKETMSFTTSRTRATATKDMSPTTRTRASGKKGDEPYNQEKGSAKKGDGFKQDKSTSRTRARKEMKTTSQI